MLKDIESIAAALYDGGWRATDRDELIAEYDLTDDEADAICSALADIEMDSDTLSALTGQESGIIIYDDVILVCNWEGFGGLPAVGPAGGIISWGDFPALVRSYAVSDVRDALPGSILRDGDSYLVSGMDVAYDESGDIPALWGYDVGLGADIRLGEDGSVTPTSGTVYVLRGTTLSSDNICTVIAPRGWA